MIRNFRYSLIEELIQYGNDEVKNVKNSIRGWGGPDKRFWGNVFQDDPESFLFTVIGTIKFDLAKFDQDGEFFIELSGMNQYVNPTSPDYSHHYLRIFNDGGIWLCEKLDKTEFLQRP